MAAKLPAVDVEKDGVYLPSNWGAAWKTAKGLHASQEVGVFVDGDSTAYGATLKLGWPYVMRNLAIAAGMTDGGRGTILDQYADASTIGPLIDGVNAIPSKTGFAAGSDTFCIGGTSAQRSTTVSDTVRYQGKGTRIRILYTVGDAYGNFTYSVDGGGAVTVTTTPVATANSGYGFGVVHITGLTEGTHTLDIVNSGGGSGNACAVVPQFFRSVGLIVHNWAVSGTASNEKFAVTNPNIGNSKGAAALGLATTAADYGWLKPEGSHPTHPTIRLAIFAHGINDMQGAVASLASCRTGCDTWLQDADNFVRMARAAGADPMFVIPHLDMATGRHDFTGLWRHTIAAFARASSCAYVDFQQALGAPNTRVARGYDNTLHSSQATYDREAAFLWNEVLNK